MKIPSAAQTVMAMTTLSPSESALFLKLLREQTREVVQKSIASNKVNPYDFQQSLSEALGDNVAGIINAMGELNGEKLDALLGGT